MTKVVEWHGTADARRIGSIRRSEEMRSLLLLLKAKLRRLTYGALDASLIDKGRGTAALAK